ncbi:glycosyltransferase [Conexibacter sp. JD483]|uniref:glycosyltransferase n=1 Tax=unclassified Conexibacter TaxID=2627773 RepID=UPI00271D1B10|nr:MULTISPECIES: glycosyltransferase [unclassified Conexibacter]MDO8187519.1 glycosyltransferase [Conexibacter sp. CPCC 205706]MDO8199238.1 glycosyltransferase [Conexibacter sp. CPCC 205762]MDR9369557.1 glycosyltransferase [Conexibacter sp. JD483]
MRVLIFHGYLLGGTGSNVYNANLAAALRRLGHEVHLLSQERAPERLPFVDAYGDWDGGALRLTTRVEPVRCTAYRPALAGLLPVYVADRYEGIEARPYPDLSDAEVEAYVEANVRAVREVAELVQPDVALANHLVMGPLILSRALPRVPYAVKIHGSALEYTVAPHPERFLAAARRGVSGARGVLVGSRHTAERLWDTLQEPDLPPRTRLGPPGVDVGSFAPREPLAARAGLRELVDRIARTIEENDTIEAAIAETPIDPLTAETLEAAVAETPGEAPSAFARDEREALRALEPLLELPARTPLVGYVGKLIVSKGVDLLLAAWPLVLAEHPDARLVVVGFGGYRATLERMQNALAVGDLETVAAIAAAGRAAEGGPQGRPLRLLQEFLARLSAEPAALERYVSAAASLRERVVWTGRLEHDELRDLLPAFAAQVVPSTFPEAFGMVAAEAAACGALPVCSDHSGLAEVAGALAAAAPAEVGGLFAFPTDEGPVVEGLAGRLLAWLGADAGIREQTREAIVATVRERWSWEGVARGVIAAAQGRLDELPLPPRRSEQ